MENYSKVELEFANRRTDSQHERQSFLLILAFLGN